MQDGGRSRSELRQLNSGKIYRKVGHADCGNDFPNTLWLSAWLDWVFSDLRSSQLRKMLDPIECSLDLRSSVNRCECKEVSEMYRFPRKPVISKSPTHFLLLFAIKARDLPDLVKRYCYRQQQYRHTNILCQQIDSWAILLLNFLFPHCRHNRTIDHSI